MHLKEIVFRLVSLFFYCYNFAKFILSDDGRAHQRRDLHPGGEQAHVQRLRGRLGQVLGH